ncbi:MAG: DUF120 domain-containing protein [Pyrobaculum sp.]|jgi:riboflavin kinase
MSRQSCINRRVIGDLLAISTVEGLTVSEAARRLCITRQGLYKILSYLKKEGFVESGRVVKISQKGREYLSTVLKDLMRFFNINSIKLEGYVVSGLGEGAFYMSLEGYRKAFEKVLGYVPYPGTLNIKLTPQSLPLRRYLDGLPGIYIPGFSNGVRTYGGVRLFKAKIRGVETAVVIPERTHHSSDVIEIIAPMKLRDVLSLRDGEKIEIEIYL